MKTLRWIFRCVALAGLMLLVGTGQLAATVSDGLEVLLASRTLGEWTETRVDNTRVVGTFVDVVVVPGTGVPYVSYYDVAGQDLWFARFVGEGGNCGPGSSWHCQLVDSVGDVGSHNSIGVRAIESGIGVSIAYHDATTWSLKVAEAVCTDSCPFIPYILDRGSPGAVRKGLYTSILYDSLNARHLAYQVVQTTGTGWLNYARRTEGSGNCGEAPFTDDWTCESVLSGLLLDAYLSLATDEQPAYPGFPERRPTIAYYDAAQGRPWLATLVNSGGNCGPSNSWYCRSPYINTHDAGTSISLFVEDSGTPHVAYVDVTDQALVYVSWVGSGGNCGFSSSTMQFEWQCDVIDDDIGNVGAGRTVAIAADPGGRPMIAYRDASSTVGPSVLRFAQPYDAAPGGAVPNCGPNPGLLYTWVCTAMDTGGTYEEEAAAVAISSNSSGIAIAYHELDTYAYPSEGNLKVLWLQLPFFADGFESGNTSGWSDSVP